MAMAEEIKIAIAKEIKISPGDLLKAPEEEDRDLRKARALIHVRGKRVGEFRGDKDSITVEVPSDAGQGPLTIVVITDAGKTVAILKYRWNEKHKKWQIEKANRDNAGPKDGLSPVVKAIGDVVAAIRELEGKLK
jgi:hypothetical protein